MVMLLLACAAEEPCAEASMTHSPGGLTVTAEEHGVAWGQRECAQCHPVWTIHQQDCVGGLDMEELRARTNPEEPQSCTACHGPNGVEAWTPDSAEAP